MEIMGLRPHKSSAPKLWLQVSEIKDLLDTTDPAGINGRSALVERLTSISDKATETSARQQPAHPEEYWRHSERKKSHAREKETHARKAAVDSHAKETHAGTAGSPQSRCGVTPHVAAQSQRRGRTLLTIFAGRRHLMEPLLMLNVQRELSRGTITHAHIWDFCMKKSDSEYVQSLRSERVEVFAGAFGCSDLRRCKADCRDKTNCRPDWKVYYAHYASPANLKHGDVLIKVDDDVAYLFQLDALVTFTRLHRPWGWVYPSIVNNDIMAHWQAHDGIWNFSHRDLQVPALRFVWARRANTFSSPSQSKQGQPYTQVRFDKHGDPGAWYADANASLRSIRYFLRRPPSAFARNITHAWVHNTRVSINVVAGSGRFVRAAFSILANDSRFPLPDEPLLSYSAPEQLQACSYAVMSSVAVHLHFGPQTAAVTSSGLIARLKRLLDHHNPSTE
ncbi:hypothetical protein AB1Y20_020929 [Prymnesium parvum]|uniref:Hexosyltransferase n=1 Tax=Prymnesium parvum TaxID=97485 RepID=A0AB34JKT4_PRYPA